MTQRRPRSPAIAGLRERVTGWAAIAESTGVTVTRARELAHRDFDPLPVLRDKNTKRVFAFVSGIAEWKLRSTVSLDVAERLDAGPKRRMKLHKWEDIKRSGKAPARVARLEKRVEAELRKNRSGKRPRGGE
jgi:hypothetical protein